MGTQQTRDYNDGHVSMTIGLLGCAVNNRNMGCLALTYSLIQLLENIGRREHICIDYLIAEVTPVSDEMLRRFCCDVGVDEKKVTCIPAGRLGVYNVYSAIRKIYHHKENRLFKVAFSKCDIVIDLSYGDSFADIYGNERFFFHTALKQYIEQIGKPLILGPQTYGPYDDERNRELAIEIIENATLILSRDQMSIDYIRQYTDKEISLCTDLAFQLKYERVEKATNKTRIGINPSSLLSVNGSDGEFDIGRLTTNYDKYINEIVNYFCANDNYEVHIIPHVGDEAYALFGDRQDCIVHREFNSPIKAKSIISSMDVFIGSRMHATIAAFSSGVATIPVAYSRKFKGLYETIGYNYVIDLNTFKTEAAVRDTIYYAENRWLLNDKMSTYVERTASLNSRLDRTISMILSANVSVV